MIQRLRRLLSPAFRAVPELRRFALALLELLARPALLPFKLSRPRSSDPASLSRLESRTNEFNAAAERYFATYPDPEHLITKPFSEPAALSRRLIDLGVLIDGLRLLPGDTVLDLGAGTGWVSHVLNLYGCRTIAVDVSSTALSLGLTLFRRDPRTNWGLNPQFIAYDGHTLPLGDATVDRVVIYDAYHHVPNPARILRELRRVLRSDGIVAMSEPGRGHADNALSHAEAAKGVLENELVLEDIADLALKSGFTATRVVIAAHSPLLEIDAHELRLFMGGRGFGTYWKNLCAALDGHHYMLLFTDDPQPTTKRPRRLKAIIRPLRHPARRRLGPLSSASPGSLYHSPATRALEHIQLRRGEGAPTALHVHNAGDTCWLSSAVRPGWTRLGVHLYRADLSRTLVDFDWLRVSLPRDVNPNDSVHLAVPLPAIDEPGEYLLVFDLVIEGVAWFAERDSVPLEVRCNVG